MTHISVELIKEMMMLYSSSPHGRLLMQKLYTDDPYDVDIKLDEKSVDRSAEIFNVRFKTLGLRLKFTKKKRNFVNPLIRIPVRHDTKSYVQPLMHISKEEKNFDFDKYYARQVEAEEKFKQHATYHIPLRKFDPYKQDRKEVEDKMMDDIRKTFKEMGYEYKENKK